MRERLEFFKMGTIVRVRAVLNAAQVCIAIAILHSNILIHHLGSAVDFCILLRNDDMEYNKPEFL